MCKMKWSGVCPTLLFFIQLISVLQIKQTYSAIEMYQSQSGVHWDNECGANIVGDAVDMVWKTYVKSKAHHCSAVHAD